MAKTRNNVVRWSFWEKLLGSARQNAMPELKMAATKPDDTRISARFIIGQRDGTSKKKTGSQFVAGQKPSERFMRKPLKARSKASLSERSRVADLAKTVTKMDKDLPLNCETQFGGYRPGAGLPPG